MRPGGREPSRRLAGYKNGKAFRPSPAEPSILPAENPYATTEPAPTLARKLHWLLLSFVPSSLLLGVTFHMTTDIASIPLLWVIPLALYLVTFIIAFGRVPNWFRLVIGNMAPVMILLLVFVMISDAGEWLGTGFNLMLHLTTFFAAALMCHYELARDRPAPQYLTNFFLWISLGGVLGGIFNAIIAPLVFSLAYEYRITLVIACAMVPTFLEGLTPNPNPGFWANPIAYVMRRLFPGGYNERATSYVLDVLSPLAMGVFFWLLTRMGESETFLLAAGQVSTTLTFITVGMIHKIAVFAVPIMLCFFFIDRPLRFALCVAAILGVSQYQETRRLVVHTERSFFGILKVEETGLQRRLVHGTTLHGTQFYRNHYSDQFQGLPMFTPWDPLVVTASHMLYPLAQEPLTYYHRSGPVGAMFQELRSRPGGTAADVAMVGLGTGSVSCYARPGQSLTFYEIDPAVIAAGEAGQVLHVHLGRREARGQGRLRAGRRPAAAAGAEGPQVRPSARRRLQLRLDPGPPAHHGGGAAVHPAAHRRRLLRPARVQQVRQAGAGGGRDRQGAGADGAGLGGQLGEALARQDRVVVGGAGEGREDARRALDRPVGEVLRRFGNYVQIDTAIEKLYGADAAKQPDGLEAKHGPVAGTLAYLAKQHGGKTLLVDAMVREYGHGFRPVETLPGVLAWTDNYADVLQVITIPEVQAIRRFFGVPTPVKE